MFITDPGSVSAFFQVVLIDLVLAGDNAVVIGMAAAGLPSHLRGKAVFWGICAAIVLRILMALFAVYLLDIVGLLLAGGFLLLWVAWKMYEELRETRKIECSHSKTYRHVNAGERRVQPNAKGFGQALSQIMIADVSMSLDNILAVAGAARHHTLALSFGLILSVALMGIAASFIARLLNKYRWIAYLGLAVIFFVALRMIVDGASNIALFAGTGLPAPHPAPVHIPT